MQFAGDGRAIRLELLPRSRGECPAGIEINVQRGGGGGLVVAPDEGSSRRCAKESSVALINVTTREWRRLYDEL